MGNLATDQITADGAAIGRDGAALGVHAVNSDPTGTARIDLCSDSTIRWSWAKTGTESGSDAGGAIYLRAFDDAGLLIDTPITIVRASGGDMTIARRILCKANTDVVNVFGRVALGCSDGTLNDNAVFCHYDQRASVGGFALRQLYTGQTVLNAASGQTILFRINNATVMSMSSTALTMTGGFLPRQVTDAGPMTATNGTASEIVWNTSDSKLYVCTVTGTPGTWAALH